MKKVIYVLLFILGISIYNLNTFAQSYSNPGSTNLESIRAGGPNKGTVCTDINSVPQDSQTNTTSNPATGSFTCRTHNYYLGSQYNRATSDDGITLCDGEDKVIGKSGTYIICRRWDDGAPIVNSSVLAYSRHTIWTNLNGTVTFGANDVSTSAINGTVQSGIDTTRYCFGSTCNLSTSSDGLAANSVAVNTQQDRILRFRTWDRNNNSSLITSVNVKIDKTDPTVIFLTQPNNGWTNNTVQNTNFRLSDTGGSNLRSYTLQARNSNNNPVFTTGWTSWADVSGHTNRIISGSEYNGSHSYIGVNNRAYEFRIQVTDLAGNSSLNIISGEITKIDTLVPVLGDVTNLHAPNIYANNSYIYGIDISTNNGSPIVSMRYQRENSMNNAWSTNLTDSSSPWSFTWDMSKVDNYREGNGGRTYTFSLNRICDEAGNCSSWTNNYNHSIFANTAFLGITSVISNQLVSTSNTADGSEKNLMILLEDIYGNKIIPATGINRTIDFNMSMNNNLRLDQYTNTTIGDNMSAVYVGNTSNEIRIGSLQGPEIQSMFNNINDASPIYISGTGTGSYIIPFYVYSPTANAYMEGANSVVTGTASMNSINFDVNDTIGTDTANAISNSSFDLRYRPKYYGEFSGEIVDRGFIEGVEQVSNYSIGINPGISGSSPSIRFEFGDVSGSSNISNARYNLNSGMSATSMIPLKEGQQASWSSITNFRSNILTSSVSTLMQSQSGSVIKETYSYLASILEYTISGKQIVYPSGIVGKSSYHGSALAGNNSYQVGVKILGNTSTNSGNEIVLDQFIDGTRIFGSITKPALKKQIEENIYRVIKNISTKSSTNYILNSSDLNSVKWTSSKFDTGNTSSRGESLYDDNVLYFGNMGGQTVRIVNATDLSGVKTLIIENGNLVIDGNILDPNMDGLLGIIVLGGDIFIDTDVTDIHAVMYTNKSIRSDKGGAPYDGADLKAADLKNQLYIKGSIFSENTLGGSRKAIPECPYYINSGCTTAQEAQAYDLNYLRRFYIFMADVSPVDGVGDTPTPSGTQSAGANASTQGYPVIIDYNSMIQSTPPVFFD